MEEGHASFPALLVGLKVHEAMSSAEIKMELVCPLRAPSFPHATYEYNPETPHWRSEYMYD